MLGTRFNLRAYPNTDQTILTLEEGKVEAHALNSEERIILHPDQQLSLNHLSGELHKQNIRFSHHINWQQGELIYKNTTLRKIFEDLENRFRIKIHVKKSGLEDELYFVSFRNGESLEEILSLLSYKRNWRYELSDSTVVIR